MLAPRAVAEDDDMWPRVRRSRRWSRREPRLLVAQRAAERRVNAERREEVSGNAGAAEQLRIAATGERRSTKAIEVAGDVLEVRDARAPVEEICRRRHLQMPVLLGVLLGDDHQLVGRRE